jgi:archaetidylinositol phosphate synthase
MNLMQTADKSFHHATRIQNSVTSGPERRALLWLAARMPAPINSDHLTVLGFAAMFLAGGCYAAARWTPWGLLLATLCLAINWFGDSNRLLPVRLKAPKFPLRADHSSVLPT